jgi:hypothetical protein
MSFGTQLLCIALPKRNEPQLIPKIEYSRERKYISGFLYECRWIFWEEQKMRKMSISIRRLRTAALSAVAAMAIGTSGAALAQHGHGGHWHGGGWGPGFVGGLAVGTAIGAGPYYYGGPYAYGYGCYVRRQVIVNRWGHRVIRHVRVCD